MATLVASQAASTSCCFHAIRGFLGGFFAEELKELAGATHVLQSETGGAEEQAHSLFQESSSVGTKTSAHLTGPEVGSLCSLRTFPQS